jgi:transcriptional regulator with XRE-family HTH domain
MKKEQDQGTLLRTARERLKKTNEQLAAELGVSEATVIAWLAPETAAKHRTMPRGSRLLLARILAELKAGK